MISAIAGPEGLTIVELGSEGLLTMAGLTATESVGDGEKGVAVAVSVIV
jgi:hypothetical protein